eukprot:TRINITY_DN15587_c0_g1_i1.p1 TRINITY_DN15587_c0_g1~~TRINITY_DN15587_c0_g1_i1.p1  ORF type:complete len:494 (-),score=119.92 TRINITY_DN15587_c0_g1_i1:214-1695(-)
MQLPPSAPTLPTAALNRNVAAGLDSRANAAAVAERFSAKAANFKVAVESGKKQIEKGHSDRLKRHQLLEEGLADAGDQTRKAISGQFLERETKGLVATFNRWSTDDFESKAVLGAGAFGTVFLVKQRGLESEQYFAVKQMTKHRHSKKNIKRGVFNERDVLATVRNRWFVELFATFQDADHIYMVMEFVPGGDLFKWIELKNRFTPSETRFYMAELLEALDVLHKHGFIHRDIKFDNMVLSASGHLKLLDFGLCRNDPGLEHKEAPLPTEKTQQTEGLKSCLKKDRRQVASQVGTVHYMAPEVMRGEVGPKSDIWAVGVMTFECLYGSPPFHAYDVEDEARRRQVLKQTIINHKTHFPRRLEKGKVHGFIPPEAAKLLLGIIQEPTERLSIELCRQEPFFSSLDFSQLHLMEPPFKPKLSGPADTRNFDKHDWKPLPAADSCGAWKDQSLEWANYEFDRDAFELQRPEAVEEMLQPIVNRAAYRPDANSFLLG